MNLYFSYGEHLASYGYVVAMRNNYVVSHVGLANSTSAIIDWVQDQEAQPGSLFHGKMDFSHIGASGHSMGGKISLLTAYDDDRIKAVADIDPVDTSPLPTPEFPSVTPELMPDIHIPTLLIGSSDGGQCAPASDNYHQYFLYANEPSIEIEIEHSGHVTFCDLPDEIINAAAIICPTGGGDFEQIRMLASRYVTAFYKVLFDGEAGYSYYLTGDGMASDVADGLVVTDHKP
jgi:predicted dienelactone hydrolase